MAARGERNAGLLFVAAGVALIAAALVFGLTTRTGGPDWAEIVPFVGGVVMVAVGLFTSFRSGTRHSA